MNRRTCRSCGAPMIWIHTSRNKPMPLNIPNGEPGNIIIESGPNGPVARVLGKGEIGTHTSHFATCPQAKQHRSPR